MKTLPLGEVPQVAGTLPEKMLACTIRPDREGDPSTAMRIEEVDLFLHLMRRSPVVISLQKRYVLTAADSPR